MSSKGLIWSLALLACEATVGGLVLFWQWQGASLGVSVGLPAGVTIITTILAWATDARAAAGQSTVLQIKQAKGALVDGTLGQLRCGRPRLGPALPASFRTL